MILVVQAWLQYQNVMVEHDFNDVESSKHMVLLGNDFVLKAGFIVDQQMPHLYLKRQLEAVVLATSKSHSLS